MEMPTYQCHKRVKALCIGDKVDLHKDGSATFYIADGGFKTITVSKDVYKRYWPMPGDYYVVYEDGYESFSPAKAFEEGYTRL